MPIPVLIASTANDMSCTTSGPWIFTLSSPLGAGEAKLLALVGLAEEHEAVLGQIGDALGPARLAEVGARREQAQLGAPEAPRDQRRIDQRPGAQRQIEALRDQVDPTGRQHHVDLDLRVAGQKLGEQIGDEAGVVAAGGEPDRTGDLVAQIGHRDVGVGQAAQRRPRALEVEPPGLRQHQLARAALEQPHAQRRLERAHPAADRRLRQPQLARRGGEAAALHHPHERRHLVQIEAVCCCHSNNMLSHRWLVVWRETTRLSGERNIAMHTISKHVPTAARLFLGLVFTVFGLNFFLHFLPMPPAPPRAAAFAGALFASGYLFPLLKATEVVAGLLLLGGLLRPALARGPGADHHQHHRLPPVPRAVGAADPARRPGRGAVPRLELPERLRADASPPDAAAAKGGRRVADAGSSGGVRVRRRGVRRRSRGTGEPRLPGRAPAHRR